MFKKPFIISAIVTLLACIPLYLLSSQEYSLTTANLPLFALSLFVILLSKQLLGRPSFCFQRI